MTDFPKTAEVVIIGGGVVGASIAYELTKRGVKDIVVLEKSYISSGSTGRCGAGVRQQWGLEMNCRLAKGSVDIFEQLTEELDYDIEFRQGGYLVLAHNSTQVKQFERNIKLQNSVGIPSRFVDKDEAREICPPINTEAFVKATYCPTDGHANPFKTNFAYARAAERGGARVYRYTEAKDILTENGRIVGVETDKGRISTNIVVNASGPWSHEVAKLAGIEIPTFSERHQCLVSEPLEPMFETMVISFQKGIYLQQVPHGSFVMGIGEVEEPNHNIRSTWQWLEFFTGELLDILPVLKDLRIVRQWGGSYNKTPDAAPILGEHEQLAGFYNAVGFSGHGFMIAPMTAVCIAQLIVGEKPTVDISPLSAERFSKGELVVEPSVVG
ncbi:MAG TPA: FAD-binding oxidoreductase [candidate division Zixibacteria bacterium]|nr:FAD-binding oxidoreductase [candidate division Zixibacteria bacterium]